MCGELWRQTLKAQALNNKKNNVRNARRFKNRKRFTKLKTNKSSSSNPFSLDTIRKDSLWKSMEDRNPLQKI